MKRRWVAVLVLLAACLFLAGAVVVEEQPRNVRLTAREAGDSISFDLRWVAPQRTAGQSPVTGYDWELWLTTTPAAPWTTLQAEGSTVAAVREATPTIERTCAAAVVYYTARVRATGDFSATAAWGSSGSVAVTCDRTPPGPPTVTMDTIPPDPPDILLPPDSTKLRPTSLGRVEWAPDLGGYRFASLGDTLTLCAISYRDGVGYRPALDGFNVSAGSDQTVLGISAHADLPCWDLVSLANGTEFAVLCDLKGCAVTTASLGDVFRFLPHWMRWPLLLAGLFLVLFGSRVDRWVSRVRRSLVR